MKLFEITYKHYVEHFVYLCFGEEILLDLCYGINPDGTQG